MLRALKVEEFRFQIIDAQGNVVANGTNAADGTISFSEITLTQAGEYTFTVVEVNTKQEYVTYDTAKFTVNVTVVNEEGVLKATVTNPEGGILFRNVYEEPPVESPDTGDQMNLKLVSGLMFLSVVALAVLLLGKKKFFG